jgi:hypothetical protein
VSDLLQDLLHDDDAPAGQQNPGAALKPVQGADGTWTIPYPPEAGGSQALHDAIEDLYPNADEDYAGGLQNGESSAPWLWLFEALTSDEFDVTISVDQDGNVDVEIDGTPPWPFSGMPPGVFEVVAEALLALALPDPASQEPQPGPAVAPELDYNRPFTSGMTAQGLHDGTGSQLMAQASDASGTMGPVGIVIQATVFDRPGAAAGNAAMENLPLIGGVIGKPLLNKVGGKVKPIVEPVGSFLGDKVLRPAGNFLGGLYNKVFRRGACGQVARNIARTFIPKNTTVLAVVKDGQILAQSTDQVMSHAEFVSRTIGCVPEGAEVITIYKTGSGEIIANRSLTYHQNALPASQSTLDTVLEFFE